MALKAGLSLKQTQRIALTPELRQSLSLLRLPMLDLIEHIQTEANENPLLKVSEPPAGKHGGTTAFDFALSHVAATITLGESIRRQLAILPLTARLKEVALYLTGDLSEDGFLETTTFETAAALGISEHLVETAIEAIQTCEPTGVGARNLNECLFLQLVEKGIECTMAQGAVDNIDLLVGGKWPALMRIMDRSKDELITLAALLRSLNPKPVADSTTAPRPLIIDVIVTNDEKRGLTISLSDQYLPQLSLDTSLLEHAKSDRSADSYIKEQHARAQTLIRAVRYRGETLLRVARAIVARQHRFFIDGPDHLTPLSRTNIADELSLHPSTVGRTIAEKNLEFNGMIYPFNFFLTTRLNKGASGQTSAYSVQRSIRNMISQETLGKTLSDEAIVKELRADGVDIARRTVAKYRECMKIPSSFERRRLLAAQRTHPRPPGGEKYLNK